MFSSFTNGYRVSIIFQGLNKIESKTDVLIPTGGDHEPWNDFQRNIRNNMFLHYSVIFSEYRLVSVISSISFMQKFL